MTHVSNKYILIWPVRSEKFNFVRYEDEKPADDHDSERDG